MITKKYKTLNGLIRSNSVRELQLDDFLNHIVYNRKSHTAKIISDKNALSLEHYMSENVKLHKNQKNFRNYLVI